jgi:predicted RNase H-like HicB family nuclease
MNHEYAIQIVWSEEDNAYIAMPAELMGCMADGSTPEEALANVRIVIQEWIETAKEEGRGIPQPLTVEEFARVQNQSNDLLQKYVQNEVQKAVSAVLSELAKSHQPQLAWGNRADLVATSVGGIVGYSSFLVPHGSR